MEGKGPLLCGALSVLVLFATWPLFWGLGMGYDVADGAAARIGFLGFLLRSLPAALSVGLGLAAVLAGLRLPGRGPILLKDEPPDPTARLEIPWIRTAFLFPVLAVGVLEIGVLKGLMRGPLGEKAIGRVTGWMALLVYWLLAWGIAFAVWQRRAGWRGRR
jgi:hypothetical protein